MAGKDMVQLESLTQYGGLILTLTITLVIISIVVPIMIDVLKKDFFDLEEIVERICFLVILTVLIIVGITHVLHTSDRSDTNNSNINSVQNHYEISIISVESIVYSSENEGKLKTYKVKFQDNPPEDKFSSFEGEVRVVNGEGALFYDPDSLDDEMIPYEAE